MILVDTSLWIDHFNTGVPELAEALDRRIVYGHPFVIGELACGNMRNRREVLELLGNLPELPAATHDEAMDLIERRHLMGRGIAYIDIHLLASVLLEPPTRLWTRDRRLAEAAEELGVAFGDGI